MVVAMPSNEDLLHWLLVAWANKEPRRDQLREQVLERMVSPVYCVGCNKEVPSGQGMGVSGNDWLDTSKPRPIVITPLCLKCMSVRLSKNKE